MKSSQLCQRLRAIITRPLSAQDDTHPVGEAASFLEDQKETDGEVLIALNARGLPTRAPSLRT